MKEFVWVEKVTSKVWVALLVWIGLAALANLYAYLTGHSGGIVQATLQLVGLFLFLTALWKWFKSRKQKA